ncbi:1-hydroxycarotenoid 3,4-desaturase CrtD [Alsobacter sp. R-9]
MRTERVLVVGAGIGGLSAAVDLAARGTDVTVLERAAAPGGKMREIPVGPARIDGGPSVFTMRWVFEELFEAAGTTLGSEVALEPANLLARHAWSADERLDLFADMAQSQDAIAAFAGPEEGRRYRAFCERTRDIYQTLERPFLRDSRPNPVSLTTRVGFNRLDALMRLKPFSTMWSALGESFRDPRLRQLYGRYSTYCGSSPFAAPATLMLVAHVEQEGVWYVRGGMYRLAEALARTAGRLGAEIRCGAEVAEVTTRAGRIDGVRLATGEHLRADAVVVNADAGAVGAGLLGPGPARAVSRVPVRARSLSAVVWTAVARTRGFPLVRHNVFFSRDYPDEFDRIFRRGQLPDEPTVYVCAQDRGDEPLAGDAPERLLILVNAPAVGDVRAFEPPEIGACQDRMTRLLDRCGLSVEMDPRRCVTSTPETFGRLFPGTGGALYGRASHGWWASFQRPDSRTRVPGLYLAGGSVHPGPGVPMAALSGRLAARSVLSDLASTRPSRQVAMSGGTVTP